MSKAPVLSVVIPVYNERATILSVIQHVLAVKLPIPMELIVVNDASADGTDQELARVRDRRVKVLHHPVNRGKGAAVRTGIEAATGQILVIQDADLEYDPADYPVLLAPILSGKADVVYGSRFLGTHRVFMFWHYIVNKFLSFLTNLMYNTMLSDMETGHKAFRIEVLRSFTLKSDRFDFEPEVTAKVFKARQWRVFETPITYSGRTYAEGKKIGAWDGVMALWTLFRYRFTD